MIDVRPPSDPSELDELASLEHYAFGVPLDQAQAWLAEAGQEHARLAWRAGGQAVGGLIQIAMGHFVGGRSVPTVGIAGVAVAPEARGQGVARALMNASLREASERGVALSSLYPATATLYRAVGYEIAGTRTHFAARVADLAGLAQASGSVGRGAGDAGELVVRRERPDDEAAVRACYERFARPRAGWLDRGRYVWRRTERQRGSQAPAHRFVVASPAGIEGYVRLAIGRNARLYLDLQVLDFAADHAAATAALVRLCAEHRSTADDIAWYGGLDDPIAQLARERLYTAELAEYWMVRITDVVAALEARGYPPGLYARLALRVVDPLLERNDGVFDLEVREGSGRCRPSGGDESAPRIDVRGLAALYTGFASPHELVERGLLAGEAEALSLLGAAFPKGAPSMRDMF